MLLLQNCGAGYFSTSPGATDCEPCAPGYFASSNSMQLLNIPHVSFINFFFFILLLSLLPHFKQPRLVALHAQLEQPVKEERPAATYALVCNAELKPVIVTYLFFFPSSFFNQRDVLHQRQASTTAQPVPQVQLRKTIPVSLHALRALKDPLRPRLVWALVLHVHVRYISSRFLLLDLFSPFPMSSTHSPSINSGYNIHQLLALQHVLVCHILLPFLRQLANPSLFLFLFFSDNPACAPGTYQDQSGQSSCKPLLQLAVLGHQWRYTVFYLLPRICWPIRIWYQPLSLPLLSLPISPSLPLSLF